MNGIVINRRSKKLNYIIIAIIIVFLVIATINQILMKIEENKFDPPGELIEIDDHLMHIHSSGDINQSPTVVMTCGSGTPSAYTEFSSIQANISTLTRTSVYERPGYGWSEAATTPRNTEQIVEDLKRLLDESEENSPYLFVAHSMGAMEVLLYAHKYPNEVLGIVLVDGTSPYKHLYYPEASISNFGVKAIKVLNQMGILRVVQEFELIPMLNNRFNSMEDEIKAIDKAMMYKNILNDMVLQEGYSVTSSAEQMYGTIELGDIPLVLLAADKSMDELPGWETSQNSLLELSSNSQLVILDNTDHISILHNSSDEIEKVIKEMILEIRSR
ncbi:alpha/beta fold hydrolase [Vallitalea okinawensis]|uniref:alpha/beta fold hydrolase n=1 Tax=Vallitalea okinawensis TaxID=2078660 RepID=UPI000CFBA326|nr:alpha/beta hydrolase [Vallitalea okinawensis]